MLNTLAQGQQHSLHWQSQLPTVVHDTDLCVSSLVNNQRTDMFVLKASVACVSYVSVLCVRKQACASTPLLYMHHDG